MKKIDWAKKLSSRKFWVCIIGFVSAILLGFGISDSVVTQVTSILSSAGCLIAYILAEGYVDGNREENENGKE